VSSYPKALQATIDAFTLLPGVGARSAERYATYLLKAEPQITKTILSALSSLHNDVKVCPKTFTLISAEVDECPLYTDKEKASIIVVENPLDIYIFEQTGSYSGTYHVLGGSLSPLDGITPDRLKIPELLSRIIEDKVREVIIATNPTVEGESTAIFINNLLREAYPKLVITRLARGLSLGLDIAYTDSMSLGLALANRTPIN
jgi:recombination protein RecR